MNCKNCTYQLKTENKFCPNCGAKVIHDRLTLKNLWSEFSQRFLNYDNTFFKTVRHMFTQPEVVIDSFISGTRKKYLNVFNYFAISITITGFFTFIFFKFFPDIFKNAMDVLNTSQQSEAQKEMFSKVMSAIFDYQSLMYFMLIPLLALISKIVFYNYKKYNYTEHAVIYLYAYSHTVVLINVLYLIFIIIYHPFLNYITALSIPLSVLYVAYVLKRLYKLSFKKIFLKTLLFIVVGLVFYIGISLVLGAIMLIFMIFDGSFMEMVHEQQRLKGK
ncbi:DUF3667 domain-containing protein [uncultured Kordia sp.]|uniref:DUF3667 domain-containing protein n=1 Tax=uncultured Kordia sp. TaxID=507699 RepID=UPI0026189B3B|nr:DUF3667 domain-containing protein [uncultured Kordia sp.]